MPISNEAFIPFVEADVLAIAMPPELAYSLRPE
jgi:hypothetical protein